MTGPTFLGIGAQKSGTTWLYRALEKRHDVWLPPVKELHFFDEKVSTPGTWLDRMHGDEPIDQRWRRQVAHERNRRLRADPVDPDERRRREWIGRYFFEPPSIAWYRSLFDDASGPRGEVTPDYAVIPDEALSRIVEAAPDARAIYLLRNPIEREWSAVMMAVRRGKRTPDVVFRMSRRHVQYLEHVDRWQRALGRDRLYIGFFDDIVARPRRLLADILAFIEADPTDINLPQGKPNSGNIETMPAEFAVALADELGPSIDELAGRFGGAAERWARTARWLSAARPEGELPYPLEPPEPSDQVGLSSTVV